MQVADVLVDGFERIAEVVRSITAGADARLLAWRSQGEGNSIGWLVWHLTRIQDDHVADAFGHGQLWQDEGWADRFDLPLDPQDTGYGHSTDEAALVRVPSAELLLGYYDAVHARTLRLLRDLGPDDLDRTVDTSWDPPVTLGVRLVSVLADDLQHAGQAAFVRGLHERCHR